MTVRQLLTLMINILQIKFLVIACASMFTLILENKLMTVMTDKDLCSKFINEKF